MRSGGSRPCEPELQMGASLGKKMLCSLGWKTIWKGISFTVGRQYPNQRLASDSIVWLQQLGPGSESYYCYMAIWLVIFEPHQSFSQKWEWGGDCSWLLGGQWSNAHGVTAETLALNQVHGKHDYSPPASYPFCSFCCTWSMHAFSLLALAGKGCRRLRLPHFLHSVCCSIIWGAFLMPQPGPVFGKKNSLELLLALSLRPWAPTPGLQGTI